MSIYLEIGICFFILSRLETLLRGYRFLLQI